MLTLTAKDIMRADVITVADELTVRELVDILIGRMITGAPVVDSGGKLVGVVSLTDVARTEGRRRELLAERMKGGFYRDGWSDGQEAEEWQGMHLEVDDEMLVRDIMTPTLFDVSEEAVVEKLPT